MRHYLTLASFALVAAQFVVITADCDAKGSHDAIWGVRGYNDRLVYEKRIKLDYKFLRKQSADVEYPPKGQYNSSSITRIELLDQESDGTGGCGYILEGGVGQSRVKIHLKTQRNEGMDFLVKIYAHN